MSHAQLTGNAEGLSLAEPLAFDRSMADACEQQGLGAIRSGVAEPMRPKSGSQARKRRAKPAAAGFTRKRSSAAASGEEPLEKLVSFRLTLEADFALRPAGWKRKHVKARLLEGCLDEATLLSFEPGSHIHDRETVYTSAKLPVKVVARVQEIAAQKGMSMSELIILWLLFKYG